MPKGRAARRPQHNSNEAKFSYGYTNGILHITDLNEPESRSVTNDIENVIAKIHVETGESLDGKRVIYCDTMNNWDGVICKLLGVSANGPLYSCRIFAVGGTDLQIALRICQHRVDNNSWPMS